MLMDATMFLLLAAAACSGDGSVSDGSATDLQASGDTGTPAIDADGDGYTADDDCDDTDASVNPEALEVCDGIDNNCVDGVDEVGGATVEGVNYPTAQDALAAHAEAAEVTVRLCPQKSRRNISPLTISAGEKVTIIGVGGPELSVVGPSTTSDLFTIEGGGELVVEGLTLSQVSLHPIVLRDDGRVTVASSVVAANSGGIVVDNPGKSKPAELLVQDSQVRGAGNSVESGIHVDGLFAVTIARTSITGNDPDTGDGAGLYALSPDRGRSTLVLDHVDFTDNEGDNGGALFASGVVVEASNTSFNGNLADESGGALYLERGATFDGNGTTEFTGNGARDGGAVFIAEGSLVGVHLHGGNNADRGGALAVDQPDAKEPLVLEDVRIEGSEANETGAGIYVGARNHVVLEKSCTLHGNVVATGGLGGGAFLDGAGSSLTIRGATVSDGSSVNDPDDVAFRGGKSVTFGTATPSVSCTFADLACAPL